MSKWVEHIKDFAKRNNLTYGCALSDPKCSEEYRIKNPKPVKAVKGKKGVVTAPEAPKAPEPVNKIPALTEPAEKKEERKEKERKRIAEALYNSLDDLTMNYVNQPKKNIMSLSDALLTMFPDIKLTTQKLQSLPQYVKDGEYTGQLLAFYGFYMGIKEVGWFMEYVNKILRGNFTGINKKKYEETYNRLHAVKAREKDQMFEMGEEDTRSRSKREYLKSPFDKFYIGEEVKITGIGRAIIVRQTKTGITLKPTDGSDTFRRINSAAQFVEKLIEGTGVEVATHTHPDGTVMTGATHTSKSKVIKKGMGMPLDRDMVMKLVGEGMKC